MRFLLGLNAALAFLLELGLLGALVVVGLLFPAALPVRIGLAVLLPVLVVLVWARWMAPRATRRLAPPGRLLLQTGLFAVAVIGLAALDQVVWAIAFAALVAVRIGLGVRLGRI